MASEEDASRDERPASRESARGAVAGERLLRVLLLIIGEDFESSEDFKVLFIIGDDR